MEYAALHGSDWQPTVSRVAALLNVKVSSIKGKEAVSLGSSAGESKSRLQP